MAVARRRNHARTTAFTRILRSLRFAVKVRAKDRTAALDALYTLNAGDPVLETIDAFRMMELPSLRSGSAFCTVNRRPLTYGMAVQAAGGGSRGKLQRVVEMTLRTLPL